MRETRGQGAEAEQQGKSLDPWLVLAARMDAAGGGRLAGATHERLRAVVLRVLISKLAVAHTA